MFPFNDFICFSFQDFSLVSYIDELRELFCLYQQTLCTIFKEPIYYNQIILCKFLSFSTLSRFKNFFSAFALVAFLAMSTSSCWCSNHGYFCFFSEGGCINSLIARTNQYLSCLKFVVMWRCSWWNWESQLKFDGLTFAWISALHAYPYIWCFCTERHVWTNQLSIVLPAILPDSHFVLVN